MAASWCKVASNLDSHPKIRKAGAMGREVFLFALRRNAEPNNKTPGRITRSELEPWYLSDQLMRTEQETNEGLTRCLTATLLRLDGDHYTIVGWDEDEWGKEKSTERVRRWREAKRSETLRNVSGVAVKRDETQETARLDQIRLEETRSEIPPKAPPGAALPPVLSLVPVGPKKRTRKDPEYTPTELAGVLEVLARLTKRNGIVYQSSKSHTALIVARMRAGFTVWDLRRVIAYCADELGWQDKPDMRPYLRPETLFGPQSFERYVHAARAWMPDAQPPENTNDHAAMSGPAWEEPTWMTTTR